ncbi:MAG: hypothetical protein JL50_13365 [Peptococcaceae bacterium BICA1-7]|nr:MAG: hypothetical protein JL50_13365 [Peptococcaceae bacterium BICA1-7]
MEEINCPLVTCASTVGLLISEAEIEGTPAAAGAAWEFASSAMAGAAEVSRVIDKRDERSLCLIVIIMLTSGVFAILIK